MRRARRPARRVCSYQTTRPQKPRNGRVGHSGDNTPVARTSRPSSTAMRKTTTRAFPSTGSTDRTVAVARENGGDVRSFAWDDDFGAARNFAIEQATGDWVLWLNPDEELLPTDPKVVRQCLARVNAFAYVLTVHDLLRAE